MTQSRLAGVISAFTTKAPRCVLHFRRVGRDVKVAALTFRQYMRGRISVGGDSHALDARPGWSNDLPGR